jgi:hypothetical protein
MLWIYSLELFLMSLASWAWLSVLLMFTTYPVAQIWAVFNNIILSLVAIFVMACYYYTGQEKKAAQPFSYFFLLIFRGLLVDWFFMIYLTWRVSLSAGLAELFAGTVSMYAMTLGLTLAFMTFSVIIAFSLVVYSVDHDYPIVDAFALNMFLTLAAGCEISVGCSQLDVILLCVYMGVYLLLNFGGFLLPDVEPLTAVINLLVSGGWFYYVFGVGNIPMLACALAIVFMIGASELVLRYTTKMDEAALSRAATPTATTPRAAPQPFDVRPMPQPFDGRPMPQLLAPQTVPPQLLDMDHDADPSAPPENAVRVDMMGMMHPSQRTHAKKRS